MKAIISVIIIIVVLTIWYFVLTPAQIKNDLDVNKINTDISKLAQRIDLLEKKCSALEEELLFLKRTFNVKKALLNSVQINGELFFLSKNNVCNLEQNKVKLDSFKFLNQYNGEKIDMKKIIYCKYAINNGKIYSAKIKNNKSVFLELKKNKNIQNIRLVQIIFKSMNKSTYTSNTPFNIKFNLVRLKTKNINELVAKKITGTPNSIIILDDEKSCFCIKGKLAIKKNNVSDIWNIENRTTNVISITSNSSQIGLKIKIGNRYQKISQQSKIKHRNFQLYIFSKQLRKGISELPYQLLLLTSNGKKTFNIWEMPNIRNKIW